MGGTFTAPAIVVGAGINGLGVVRSLGAQGISVVVVERSPGGPACDSRYASPRLYGSPAPDAKDDFVGYIGNVARGFAERPTLFLTQEAVVSAVSRQRERLDGHVRHVLADHSVLTELMDKASFQARANALGFPVPSSTVLQGPQDLDLARTLAFPCVLKPIAKSEVWEQRNKKAYRFESFADLSAAYRRLHVEAMPVIVQEWIKGSDADVYFTLVYRDASQATKASFTGRKIRQWPPLVGGTASCMPAPAEHAELSGLTTKFFDAVGFVGLGSMEFKRDARTGRFFMVEPTVGRTDYQEEIATLNGVNIPFIAHCALTGREVPSMRKPRRVQIWRDALAEEKSAAATKTKLPPVAHGLAVVDALFRVHDPNPWLKEVGQRGAQKLRSLMKTNAIQVRSTLRWIGETRTLPAAAKRARTLDRRGLPPTDPGCERIVDLGIDWLCRAQDMSRTQDGGFARDFSLVSGWAPSYPETSGYIVPTLLEAAKRRGSVELVARARRCLDWLVSIQFPEGGFQGGTIGQTPCVPVTFNTGQILLGLAAGTAQIDRGRYLEPMRKAAQWLVDTQDDDGCWRRFSTPFAKPGEKTYETHVAWGLFEAARILPDRGFGEAGMRQVAWALTNQQPNGWFRFNCLDDAEKSLTHTIGYALRGLIEAYNWSPRREILDAACKTADGVSNAIEVNGLLPGRLDRNWSGRTGWICLTGSSQIAHCLFLLAALTGRPHYVANARRLTSYVRRTVSTNLDQNVRGGVKGSFPIDGAYGRFQYLNWACKFTIDALWAEQDNAATTA